jgi:hypothetical protein
MNTLKRQLEGRALRVGVRSPVATILAGPLGPAEGLALTAAWRREMGEGRRMEGEASPPMSPSFRRRRHPSGLRELPPTN